MRLPPAQNDEAAEAAERSLYVSLSMPLPVWPLLLTNVMSTPLPLRLGSPLNIFIWYLNLVRPYRQPSCAL